MDVSELSAHLLAGQAIPAHPLALTAERKFDERRQRALTRYYVASGVGGVAVGVHTTQFVIRDHGMLAPVLSLAAETVGHEATAPVALIAGAIGATPQAVAEARVAADLGYDAVLLSLGALREADDDALIAHCGAVADVLPLFGFYLQPAVGGRVLSYAFWRRFAEIERVVAIKIAPFNRYRTHDVVRAVADSGRRDIALYTGNDDSIVVDLLTRWPTARGAERITGGLLGQWAVWTSRAVSLVKETRALRGDSALDPAWLTRAAALTDANGAIFDVANDFSGCIAGIHEVLRRQGLLAGTWCLDANEGLSRGQAAEIDRVLRAYPELTDDAFVAQHRDAWLR